MKVKIKLINKNSKMPEKKSENAAGYDLCADIDSPVTIEPGTIKMIGCGAAAEPEDENSVGLVFPRSGTAAKHGVTLVNSVGVIDSDYRGEIKAALINLGGRPYTVNPGDRIAQLVYMPVLKTELELSRQLGDTVRGEGGFGSTGKS